ncbi:MAG: hypothetical protein ACNA8R_14880 [Nitriliruptoraceae bacterium]
MGAQKAHSLISQVYDPRNLARAWQRVKKNRGAGGIDGMTIERFDKNRDRYLALLHSRLKGNCSGGDVRVTRIWGWM